MPWLGQELGSFQIEQNNCRSLQPDMRHGDFFSGKKIYILLLTNEFKIIQKFKLYTENRHVEEK